MKKLATKQLALLTCTAMLAVLACQRSAIDYPQSGVQNPQVQAAKAWFEEHAAASIDATGTLELGKATYSKGKKKNPPKGKPQWAKAWVGKDGAVEVPMDMEVKRSFSRNANPSDAELSAQVTRLLVLKDKKDREYSVYMHITAEPDYLAKCSYNLQANRYKNVLKGFSGRVLYFNLDGSFNAGWRYVDGKITASISLLGRSDGETVPSRQQQSACTVYWEGEYMQWCWYTSGGSLIFCEDPIILWENRWGECADDGSGGGDPGGGGGGSPNPPDDSDAKPKDPCAQAKALQNDAAFQARINSLSKQLGSATEEGYRLKSDGSLEYPTEKFPKHLEYNRSNSKYTEAMHSHRTMGSFKLSAGDIRALYKLFEGNNMVDVSTFRYGVVSVFGCMVIQISDPAAFEEFGKKHGLKEGKKNLENFLKERIPMVGSYDEIMGGFINTLNQQNSGLSVIFKRVDENGNIGDWQVKQTSGAKVVDKNCP